LPLVLAIFTALALVSAVISPLFTVAAQDAAADTPQVPNVYRAPYDFTGDSKSDFVNVVVGAAGTPITWKVLRNPANPAPNQAFIRIFDYGVSGDTITAGNYLGDAKSEVSVWRSGQFIHAPFPEGTGGVGPTTFVNWGLTTAENPGRVGDYDGDGKDDEVIIRVQANVLNWHIRGSAGTNRVVSFGGVRAGFSTLAFQGSDFDGDGRDELVMANASTGTGANTWWIGDSITGNVKLAVSYGNFITDYFISPDDYTGDGLADIVVYRGGGSGGDGGGWYIRNTATGGTTLTIFGIPDPAFTNEDVPVRGDFDGDGRADICVYRRDTATYYWINSSVGIANAQQWGEAGNPADLPLGLFFNF
jgi:hypothetical protein